MRSTLSFAGVSGFLTGSKLTESPELDAASAAALGAALAEARAEVAPAAAGAGEQLAAPVIVTLSWKPPPGELLSEQLTVNPLPVKVTTCPTPVV
jgi:hypothetical protein